MGALEVPGTSSLDRGYRELWACRYIGHWVL